jgi:Protein of unknown function (DUF3667)
MQSNLCKNCNHTFQGNFCSNCGQKATTHDIDFKFIVHEVPHSALHLNKGIFFTIKEMSTRPGKTIKEYIDGKRVNHFPPLTYLLILTSTFIFIKSLQFAFGYREIAVKRTSEFDQFLDKNILFVFLLLVPFYALIYKLFHLKFRFNYWQLLVAQTFVIGHVIFIMLIPQILFFFFPETRNFLKGYFLLATIAFQIFTYYQLFHESHTKKLRLLFREVMCYLVATLFSLAFTFLLLALVKHFLDIYHH